MLLKALLAQCSMCKESLTEGKGDVGAAPMSDLALGMGWSIYLMLAMVAFMVAAIVVLIVRSEKQRMQRARAR